MRRGAVRGSSAGANRLLRTLRSVLLPRVRVQPSVQCDIVGVFCTWEHIIDARSWTSWGAISKPHTHLTPGSRAISVHLLRRFARMSVEHSGLRTGPASAHDETFANFCGGTTSNSSNLSDSLTEFSAFTVAETSSSGNETFSEDFSEETSQHPSKLNVTRKSRDHFCSVPESRKCPFVFEGMQLFNITLVTSALCGSLGPSVGC